MRGRSVRANSMTPQQIIDQAKVPETNAVFVLGCFERRVTVYAQQVRALNLVDAIISQGVMADNGRVAIIGGGAAGVTAGVAFAKGMPNLKQLDLFEMRPSILELQRNSTRYLHPHFYDWPGANSNDGGAGLPIMNWQAGAAGDVAQSLEAEFEATRRSSVLNPRTNERVTALKPSSIATVRVETNGSEYLPVYDIVVLAIGFGLEAYLEGGATPSYWSQTELAGPLLLSPNANPTIFISGNGDGGLVDFQMAAFNGLQHRESCELIQGLDFGAARAELEVIEQEAWATGADVDLWTEYSSRVRPLIPPQTWAEITHRLRPNCRIHLHTREEHLLRRTSALH